MLLMYLGALHVNQPIERVMTTFLRIFSCIASLLLAFMITSTCATAQIVYDWQDSKEGWVPASESNLGCNLIEQPEAMAMRAFNTTPVMRSGTINESLGIDAGTYDRVQITLRNPTTSGNPNARLFAYAPETNAFMCHWNVPVDTEMEGFQTYTLDLTSPPNSGSGTFEGTVGRFGWRGPWGVANGDTIYWKQMVVYNSVGCTNAEACNYAPYAEVDNGMCVLVGDSCDDGNDDTINDMITADCLCAGEVDEVQDTQSSLSIGMAPNPVSMELWVTSSLALGRFRVLDAQGKVCLTEHSQSVSTAIDVSGWLSGTYFLETHLGGIPQVHRFIVHRP